MSNSFERIAASDIKSQEEANATIRKLFEVAQPGAIYAPPLTVGDQTIITASEVTVGMGLGFGSGGSADEQGGDSGGGGGGGGMSAGRPVAVISIGPGGVHVEPVVDATKIAIALFTALGAVFLAWRRMQRVGKELAE